MLLPAYIGWSPREGSGVFDPIAELGLPFAFYRVDETLSIDVDDLERVLREGAADVLVLIHYFGRVEPGYADAVGLARRHGALVLEDEAHSMLSDLVGGISGRLGDACIFSLHKLLPVGGGGLLVLNPGAAHLAAVVGGSPDGATPWDYDLAAIASRRRDNFRELLRMIEPLRGRLDPLWGDLGDGEIPQTLPVLVRTVPRDRLYAVANEHGFGVVSLYHTLIREIPADRFPASFWLSRRILNLPVHQDMDPERASALATALATYVDDLARG